MTTLAKDLRRKLTENFTVERPKPSSDLKSEDGSRKWLLKFEDGHEAETVFIPEDDRGALCVSSQVGCTSPAPFVIPAHNGWYAISVHLKSSASSWSPAMPSANGQVTAMTVC